MGDGPRAGVFGRGGGAARALRGMQQQRRDWRRQLHPGRERALSNAPRCGVSLNGPPVYSSSLTPVEACQQYYKVACLHGLASSPAPTTVQVQACVDAINGNACDNGNLITNPQLNPSCTWLTPPVVVVVDASTDVEAGAEAATTDAAEDTTTPSDDSGLIIIGP